MPEIDFAFLADAADARPGQKFSVLGGGVTRIGGPAFPLQHPHLALVVGLRLAPSELQREVEMGVLFVGPDGGELSSASARIRAEGPGDGRETVVTFCIDLWNLVFPAGGEYRLRLLVEGVERKRLPLVVERQAASGPITPPFPPPPGQA